MGKHNKKQYKEHSIVEYLSKLEEQSFLSGYDVVQWDLSPYWKAPIR